MGEGEWATRRPRQRRGGYVIWTSHLRRFISAVDRLNDRVGNVVLYLVPALVFVMTYEVVARYVFLSPTIWAFETSQFLFCVSIALGAGFTLRHGRHVNVDIVVGRLKTRARAVLNLVTIPLLLAFVGVLLQLTVEATIDSYRYLERAASYWAPPLYPVYTLMAIGVFLMAVQGVAEWMRNLITAVTGVAEGSAAGGGHA